MDALQGLIVEILDGLGLGAVADQIGDELVNVVPLLSQANSGVYERVSLYAGCPVLGG
ncbi:hypothetical protein RQN9TF_33270 (plasmid) [Rhodococcus qingshengii]|uniref:hypothetical protein n=1 Tax=Rhodococcus TaxID=1827 RepID=UPI0013DE1A62|nr:MULTISPECIES: hypothetical protein [Rhodococcus]BDQ24135.1 hypothetical protein RQN9TF_33270 [Rhodococcus qingshengii]